MRKIRCPYCGFSCRRHGKTSAGTQRWYCSNCKIAFTSKNDHQLKDFNLFKEQFPLGETLLFGENFIKLILILVFTGTKNTLFVL